MNTPTPPHQPLEEIDLGAVTDDSLDDMVDGDRQLTTDSDAIDGGLNDSDLGSPRDMEGDADNGTGLRETR